MTDAELLARCRAALENAPQPLPPGLRQDVMRLAQILEAAAAPPSGEPVYLHYAERAGEDL